MRAGWIISITLHGAAIFAALFMVPYDEDRLRDVDRTTNVSLVEAPAPEAPNDQAPEVQEIELANIQAPSFDIDVGDPPDVDVAPTVSDSDIIEAPSARDTEADLTALTEEVAQPEVAVRIDAPEESAPEPVVPQMVLPGTSGLDTRNEAPRGPQLSSPAAPRQAPRISTFSAPPPPKPAKPAEEEVAAVEETPDPAPVEEQPEPQEEAVPEEATTEPSPDPESGAEEEEGIALRRAPPPRKRPENFAQQVEQAAAAAAAQELQEELENELARQIERTLEEAQEQQEQDTAQTGTEEPTPEEQQQAADAPAPVPDVPVGPPLTAGEKDALRVSVQRCWNVPAGLEGAEGLRVVLAVELDPDGRVIGQPRLIEPASVDRREIRIAFEAARRALLRCQGSGYPLPREKYEQWRDLEVGFDPSGMLARW